MRGGARSGRRGGELDTPHLDFALLVPCLSVSAPRAGRAPCWQRGWRRRGRRTRAAGTEPLALPRRRVGGDARRAPSQPRQRQCHARATRRTGCSRCRCPDVLEAVAAAAFERAAPSQRSIAYAGPLSRAHLEHGAGKGGAGGEVERRGGKSPGKKGFPAQTDALGSTEGVRWKGYPSKLLHAAAFRVAKTP